MKVQLILENGKIFTGESLGATGKAVGEVVFNTGMTGYQEVLTDPSYFGQMVVMTYPLIGNYGINSLDSESSKPWVKGYIVREACNNPGNFRCEKTLNEYMIQTGIIGIQGIDTRALTRMLRDKGTMNGMICPLGEFEKEVDHVAIKEYKIIKPGDHVTCDKPVRFKGEGPVIVLIDYGVKKSMINSVLLYGAEVVCLPASASVDEIFDYNPDGIMLSNGPGDPCDYSYQIEVIKSLKGRLPILGICLGHQLMALASGAKTVKLKFGHHGGNHPVKDILKDKTFITSQNHEYAVLPDSLTDTDMVISHINMNDKTVEGIRYTDIPAFSVQYHPEASPGPLENRYIFKDFLDMVKKHKGSLV